MARQPRVDMEGTYLHVLVRGRDEVALFRDGADREAFLERLADVLDWGEATCLGWALLDSQAHLILERGPRPLGRVMHRLNFWYASYFNRRHGRSGVLAGRYRARVVDADAYLAELVRYVHLTPVEAGLVQLETLDAWPWSSYSALMGQVPARLVAVDEVLGLFGDEAGAARRALARWLADGWAASGRSPLADRLEGRLPRGERPADNRVIGDAAFVGRLLMQAEVDEAQRAAVLADGWTAPAVLSRVCGVLGADEAQVRRGHRSRTSSRARALTAWLASEELGVANFELARLLGTSGSAITRVLLRGEALAQTLAITGVDGLPEPEEAPTPDPPRLAGVSVDQLLAEAAAEVGATVEEVLSPSRRRHLSPARQAVALLAVNELGWTGAKIARRLNRTPGAVSGWVRHPPAAGRALASRLIAALG